MTYEIRDPFAKLIGMHIEEIGETSVTTSVVLQPAHLNPYNIAHGGVAYSMGCITAQLAGKLCRGREMEVESAACQYLSAMATAPVRCRAELVENTACRVEVWDGAGTLCFLQIIGLRPVEPLSESVPERARTIFPAGPDAPVDPVTGIAYPCPASGGGFERLTHIYIMGREENVTRMGTDILTETSDSRGAAHCGLIYTCCDTGIGVTGRMMGKNGVTVSSAIRYIRPAVVGPVFVETTCVRDGNTIMYFEAMVTDGNGDPVAVGQFTLHPMKVLKDKEQAIVEAMEKKGEI